MLPIVLMKLFHGLQVAMRAKKLTRKGRPNPCVNTDNQVAQPVSPSLGSPPRAKYQKPLPPTPALRAKRIQTPTLLRRPQCYRSAAAPFSFNAPTKYFLPHINSRCARLSFSSINSDTGSLYTNSPVVRELDYSDSQERRVRMRDRLDRILTPGLVANKFTKFAAASGAIVSSPKARTPSRSTPPRAPPGLPTPAHLALHDINIPLVPQPFSSNTFRNPIRNGPPAGLPTSNRTITSRPSAAGHSKIFSPDLKVEEIGSGAYGKVYRIARQTRRSRVVRAVKLVDLTDENAAFEFCRQEIKILQALHQYQLYFGRDSEDDDYDEDYPGLKHVVKLSPQDRFLGLCGNGYLYIIMQYYPASLEAFRHCVTEDELALRFIISQVTLGLNFLHSIGVIHMDLKPGNIFVSERGNCVIGDFNGSSYDPEFKTPTWVGGFTPGFVAPEARDKHHPSISDRSDFWSLGVTIYDLVVEHDPFELGLTYAQMGLVAMKMAEKMDVYGCPSEIWYMVMKMCQHNWKDRWDAQKILDHLDRNFEPLPSISPLLEYYQLEDVDDHDTFASKDTTRKRRLDRLAIRQKLGFDLHSTNQIDASYIK